MEDREGYVRVGTRYYRILDSKECGCSCGESFPVTCKTRTKRFLNGSHKWDFYARRLAASQQEAMQRRRQARWQRLLEGLVQGGKLRQSGLLSALGAAYHEGYHAGRRCALKRIAKGQAA